VYDSFYNGSPNGESPCAVASKDAKIGGFNLGTIAVVQYEDDNSEQSYFGSPIVTGDNLNPSADNPWNVNDSSWSIDVEDFCVGLSAIENAAKGGCSLYDLASTVVGGVDGINVDNAVSSESECQNDTDHRKNWYFVTSQALPDRNLEFERVRILPLPQNQSGN